MRRSRFALMTAALLLGCSDGPVTPSVDDPDALLTDSQLATPQDPSEAQVDPAWSDWIIDNHRVIRSLTSTRTSDLQFLKQAIGSRRFVQLGESGHGVREFSIAKVRLIRFLHEEMGFDVIAFESGFYDCYRANRLAAESQPHQTMGRCVYGVWSTEEVLDLFEYIRETRSTQRPLTLAGFDTNFSGTNQQFGTDLMFDVLSKVDTAFARRLKEMDAIFYSEYQVAASSHFGNQAATAAAVDSSDAKYRYQARYDSARVMIEANIASLTTAFPSDPQAPLIAGRVAVNRLQFLEQIRDPSANGSSTDRDRNMAANVDFLLDKLYPGKKIIGWAHNAHIMHDRSKAVLVGGASAFPQSMGSFITARRRADVYTIGLFMYRGAAANNSGASYTISPTAAGSLEAVMYRARKQWTFVDMLGQTRTTGNSWMFTSIPAKEWGTYYLRLVLRDQFDGILFIDTVNPPNYYTPTGPGGGR